MCYLKYYMKILFSEILTKTILFLVYGGIFILSTAGYADFDPQKIISNNTNLIGRSNPTRIDYKVNYPLAIEEAIFGKPKENFFYDDFHNEEILSDEGANIVIFPGNHENTLNFFTDIMHVISNKKLPAKVNTTAVFGDTLPQTFSQVISSLGIEFLHIKGDSGFFFPFFAETLLGLKK